MKSIPFILGGIWLLLTAIACEKENSISPDNGQSQADKINLSKVRTGQINKYVLFIGEDYKDAENAHFQYLSDTLLIEVIEEDSAGYLIKEYLSPGSASLHGEHNVSHPSEAAYYYLTVEQDMLNVQYRDFHSSSRLFSNGSPNSFQLPFNYDCLLEVKLNGWKTSIPPAENLLCGFIKNAIILEKNYERLQVYIDNRELLNNQPGYTHLYSSTTGLVRTIQYSLWTNKGYGWDLVP